MVITLAVYLALELHHVGGDELVQRAHRDCGTLRCRTRPETPCVQIAVTEDDVFVRSQSVPVLPPPVIATGPIGWLRANLFSSPLNTLLTVAVIALLVLGGAAGDPFPVHRRDLERGRPRSLSARRLTAWRAPAGHSCAIGCPISSTGPIRSRSAGGSMCSSPAGVRRRLAAVARRAAACARRALFLRRHAGPRLRAAQWLAADRPAGGRYLAVGRRAGHRRRHHGRNGRVAAARNRARARAALLAAGGADRARSCSSSSCAACR